MQPGTRWPFDADDGLADDGVGQRRRVRDRRDRRRQHHRVRGRSQRDRAAATACATARSAIPAGLTDGTSYEGGPKVERVRPRDRGPQRAHRARDREVGRHARRTTSPTRPACTTSSTNHNKFLPGNGFGYEGANGFKTGYTEIADHTLVATAKRNGRQCIAVILGSSDSGYTWAASLLDKCWRSRRSRRTGMSLPPVAVSPYAARASPTQAAFTKLASAHRRAIAAPTTARADDDRGLDAAPPTAAGSQRRRGRDDHDAPTTPTRASITAAACSRRRDFVVVLFLLVARGRVRAPAPRGEAPTRACASPVSARGRKAMRSGSLPVVDGRYRTGTRRSAGRVARTRRRATTSTSPSRTSRARTPAAAPTTAPSDVATRASRRRRWGARSGR